LLGQSGVGKTLAARYLHHKGDRSQHPFVTVHCAALPEDAWEKELFGYDEVPGRLELASGGTLYLNSVGELPASAQARLFRVFEEKRFERKGRPQSVPLDVRVVASSSTHLAEQVSSGSFREDLYFQLKVVALEVPALADRKEDLDELSKGFLRNVSREHGRPTPDLDPELLQWMKNYDWPGNVRELKNLLERCLILSGPQQKTLGLGDLPEDLGAFTGTGLGDDGSLAGGLEDTALEGPLRQLRARFESHVLKRRLEQCGGNVTKAAESLGIERAHLHRKLKSYGLGAS
jgi:two-component system nitrogen regulation response regulator NtrX